MTDECYCDYDYEPARVWEQYKLKAKKRHRCSECGGPILPGEQYERVWYITYDGDKGVYKTCQRCLNIVAYVEAHVPCFCWYRQGLYEDGGAVDTCDSYAHEAPGLMFGLGRLIVTKNRFNETNRAMK